MKTFKAFINGQVEVKPMDFISGVFFCILEFILSGFIYTVFSFVFSSFLEEQYAFFFPTIIMYIFTAYIFLKAYSKYNYNDIKGRDVNYTRKATLKSLFIILILVLSIRIINDALLSQILEYLASKSNRVNKVAEIMSKENRYLLIMQIWFLGPIFEEFIYRGLILNGLLNKYNPTKAILFSSIFFSISHGNLPQMLNAFILGLLLGYICFKTKSLYAAIFAHMLLNFLPHILGVLRNYTPIFNNPIFLLTLGGLLFGVFIFIYRKSNIYRNEQTLKC